MKSAWTAGSNCEGRYIYRSQVRFTVHCLNITKTSLTFQEKCRVYRVFLFNFKDECSFVSLRDVERAMQVMVWFYNHVDILGRLMRNVINEQRREEGDDSDEEDDDFDEQVRLSSFPFEAKTETVQKAFWYTCYNVHLSDRYFIRISLCVLCYVLLRGPTNVLTCTEQ